MAKIERKATKQISKWDRAKAIFLTGTSHMIPVLVAAGFLQAIGKAMGGYDIMTNEAMHGTFAYALAVIGQSAMDMAIPVFGAFVAYAIGDKPALAGGFACGWLSRNYIGAGFVGALAGGIIVGLLAKYMKTMKVPSWMKGLMNILVIPLFTSFVAGLILFYVVGGPIAFFMGFLKDLLISLQGVSSFALGAVMGSCWGIDFGGPVTQTAAAFSNALNAEGIYNTTAVKMAAGMAPPIAMALCTFINRKKFGAADYENAKVALPLGCCFITEGALPFFLSDPVRVWLSCIPGCALGGGLSMYFGVESPALHGGVFAIPLMNKPLMFLIALGANIALTTLIYTIIRKKPEDAKAAKTAA